MIADLQVLPQPWAVRDVYLLDDHEVVRRGLRQMLESDGFCVVGASGSAREAARQIPVLRPELVIVDDDLPDGSGADVCRAIGAAEPAIRCVLMTGDADEGVLIDSILAGAWGCLSKQDGGSEQLRLIHRVSAGHTAYSRRFLPALEAPARRGTLRPGERLLTLTRQEMNAAIGLGRGLTNRQISQEMGLSEKTVKNMVSTVLRKLGAARRTQAAVFIATEMLPVEGPSVGGYRSHPSPDQAGEVAAALLNCVSESRTESPTDEVRARYAARLADALAAARTGTTGRRPLRGPGNPANGFSSSGMLPGQRVPPSLA